MNSNADRVQCATREKVPVHGADIRGNARIGWAIRQQLSRDRKTTRPNRTSVHR